MHQLRRLLHRMQDSYAKTEEEPGQVEGWKQVCSHYLYGFDYRSVH